MALLITAYEDGACDTGPWEAFPELASLVDFRRHLGAQVRRRWCIRIEPPFSSPQCLHSLQPNSRSAGSARPLDRHLDQQRPGLALEIAGLRRPHPASVHHVPSQVSLRSVIPRDRVDYHVSALTALPNPHCFTPCRIHAHGRGDAHVGTG